jgi:Tol biopolymer transport system component
MKRILATAMAAGATVSLLAMPAFEPWSVPVHLGAVLNSPSEEEGPEISKDGLSLYFYSLRAGGLGGEDLWVAQRSDTSSPWGMAINLGASVNTPSNERAPALSRDGHRLFFASSRPGGRGGLDLWVSWRDHTWDDFGWQAPQHLGGLINTAANDSGPTFFENDEAGVPQLFFVSNRPGGLGMADIYVSEQRADGTFGPAVAVTDLNSPALETRPSIRHDGREIVFTSQRPGGFGNSDLWMSMRDTVWDPWSRPVNLGPAVNTSFSEGTPGISSRGTELYFHSDRPGSLGDDDLYVSTRTKKR